MVLGALVLGAVVLGGCGSDKKASTTPGPSGTAASGASGAQDVGVRTIASLGQVLVDKDGRTLYTFKPEDSGTVACTGSCATTWPPALAPAGGPAVGDQLTGKVATIARPDGAKQLTYNGHPLYRYAADQQAGDAHGQGVGNVWFVATPATPATTATTEASSGAYR
jgi:predicted lipoprotein with Yx(FWY)xxD motif